MVSTTPASCACGRDEPPTGRPHGRQLPGALGSLGDGCPRPDLTHYDPVSTGVFAAGPPAQTGRLNEKWCGRETFTDDVVHETGRTDVPKFKVIEAYPSDVPVDPDRRNFIQALQRRRAGVARRESVHPPRHWSVWSSVFLCELAECVPPAPPPPAVAAPPAVKPAPPAPSATKRRPAKKRCATAKGKRAKKRCKRRTSRRAG